jgi:hypothetical protein
MSYKHVIVEVVEGGLGPHTFGPAIPHKLPRTLSTIPWFQLRDRSRKLTSGQFTSPQ